MTFDDNRVKTFFLFSLLTRSVDLIVPILHNGLKVGVVGVRGGRRRSRRGLIVPGAVVAAEREVGVAFGRVGTEAAEALPVDRVDDVLVRLRLVRLVVLFIDSN